VKAPNAIAGRKLYLNNLLLRALRHFEKSFKGAPMSTSAPFLLRGIPQAKGLKNAVSFFN